jgi:sugar lactone lactonase YvrE
MKWLKGAKEGIIVAGGQGQGNALTQLSYPRGVVVDQLGTIYVADHSNHRVMRWLKGATQGSVVVGGNGLGVQTNQFNAPFGLSFDRQNNLYVVDYNNHRVQRFNIEPNSNS